MKYRLVAVLLALLAGGLLWVLTSRHPAPAAARSAAENPSSLTVEATHEIHAPATSPEPVSTESTPSPIQDSIASVPTGAVPARPKYITPAAVAELPPGPELAPGLTPVTVLENMRGALRQYGARFGGNPVGNNPEITAALNGGNSRQVVFLNPDDGMRINERGELVDNWGTPFFFHQLSATEMEIHSAGPDRKMWTADDLVVK